MNVFNFKSDYEAGFMTLFNDKVIQNALKHFEEKKRKVKKRKAKKRKLVNCVKM